MENLPPKPGSAAGMAPSRYFFGRFVNETCFIRKNAEDFMRNLPRSCAGTPDQTLTGGLPLRRRSLYTTELQGQIRGGTARGAVPFVSLGNLFHFTVQYRKSQSKLWGAGRGAPAAGMGKTGRSAPAVRPDGQALSACGGQRTRKAGEPRTAVIFLHFVQRKSFYKSCVCGMIIIMAWYGVRCVRSGRLPKAVLHKRM